MTNEYENSVPGATATSDTNKLTAYLYDGMNNVTRMSVNNVTPTGTVPQTTTYSYQVYSVSLKARRPIGFRRSATPTGLRNR